MITDEIASAIQVLGGMLYSCSVETWGFEATRHPKNSWFLQNISLDGVTELQARAHYVRVLAVHVLPDDVIVLGKPRGCELAGRRIQFVPPSPAQRYYSAECRREAVRRRHAGARSK